MPRPRPVTVWSYNTPLPRTSHEEWIETEVEIEGEHNEMGEGDVVHVDHFHWVNGSTARSVSETWGSEVETPIHSSREANHKSYSHNSSRFNVVSRRPPPSRRPHVQLVAPPVQLSISRLLSVAPEAALNSWDDEELPGLPDGSTHTPTHISPPLAPSPILRSASGSVQGSGVYKRDQPVRFASDALHHVVCNEFVNNHAFSKTPSDTSSRHPSLRRLSGSKGSSSPMRYSFRVQPSESGESEEETTASPNLPVPADTPAGFVNTPIAACKQSEGFRDGVSPLSTSREPSLPVYTLPSRSALTSPPRDSPPRRTSIGVQSETPLMYCAPPDIPPPVLHPVVAQPPVADHTSSISAFNSELHQQYMGLLRTALEGNISVATALTNVALEAVQKKTTAPEHTVAPPLSPPPPVQPHVFPTPNPTAIIGDGGVRARDLFGDSTSPKRLTPPVSPTTHLSSSSSSSGDCEGDHGERCRYHRHRRREGAVVRIQRHVRPIQHPLQLTSHPSPPRHPPQVAATSLRSREYTIEPHYTVDTQPRSVYRDPIRVDGGATYQRPPSPVSHSSAVNTSFSDHLATDHSHARRGSSVSVSTSTRALGSRYRSPSLPDVQAVEEVDVSAISRRSSTSQYNSAYRSTSVLWQPSFQTQPLTQTEPLVRPHPASQTAPYQTLPSQPKSPREADALGSTVVFKSTPFRPTMSNKALVVEKMPEPPHVRRHRLLPPPPSPPRSPTPKSEPIPKINVPTAHSSRTVSASSFADVESTTSPVATQDVRRASVSRSQSVVSMRKTVSVGTVRETTHESSQASVSSGSSAADGGDVNVKYPSSMSWLSVDSTPFQKSIDPTNLHALPIPVNPQLREVSPSRFILRTTASSSSTSTLSHPRIERSRPRFQVPSSGQTPH